MAMTTGFLVTSAYPKLGLKNLSFRLISESFRYQKAWHMLLELDRIGTYIHLLPIGWLLLPPQNHHFSSNSPSQSMDSDHPHRIPQVRFSFNFSPLFCLGTWLIRVSASSTGGFLRYGATPIARWF